MSKFSVIFSIVISTLSVLPAQFAQARDSRIPAPSQASLELDLLTNPRGNVITADTIYQQQLTVPSLWWAQEQSENKLLDNWIAYPAINSQPGRVDLIVNEQIWSVLDYLERYKFVNHLGSVARTYGYNIRVFNYEKEPLATYTCNLSLTTPLCNIDMNATSLLTNTSN
ncbi:hypothetical protein Riv7116_1139 [Rivularia sp. PCC 7116]|uniref:hypothetical protein n=1 Tax=Rivularia sp. PCC 7116 TaxID=373994 RepID=UPI00029EC972|nr:hypothetical protein [Rivularia sp. PCC 7116]AFY53712.1 hypothetical protein Riv7116_1139 [Rivularia sp. PCC 7116]